MTRFEDALERFRRRLIGAKEAGELLGVSGRQFRRLCLRFDDKGADGLRDRRFGRVSPRRSDVLDLGRMGGLYRDRYCDFTAKHFQDVVVAEHTLVSALSIGEFGLEA